MARSIYYTMLQIASRFYPAVAIWPFLSGLRGIRLDFIPADMCGLFQLLRSRRL